ncbi:hypothetical protein [Pasteuria penetrans]|uniref:hypothetical protein n=1 Tax=Pasteuria penetrans TaxID=86005 RepID=UPI0011ECCF74|nr:hypothetical protein [Pasteuria penetrans]
MHHNKKKLGLLALTLTTTLGIGAPSLMIGADFAIGSASDGEWIIGVASDDDMMNQMIKKEEDPMMKEKQKK